MTHEKYNFCTLFNTQFLSRGLAMYKSLQDHCPNFHLYIYAFDEYVATFFNDLMHPNVTIIKLADFEDPALFNVKATRTATEYYWTCTPSVIKHSIEHFNLDHCTYLDADLYFFANPQILIDEIPKDKSVMITEHRYTPRFDQSSTSGKYCVQFIYFKNDPHGKAVLNWWREACIEWCFNRVEDNKFGDQRYLDDWTTRFTNVHELEHLGGGVAPWNIERYRMILNDRTIHLQDIKTKKEFMLVFYHFHSLRYFVKSQIQIANHRYIIESWIVDNIYKPYIKKLSTMEKQCLAYNKNILPREEKQRFDSLRSVLRFVNRRIFNTADNFFSVDDFI